MLNLIEKNLFPSTFEKTPARDLCKQSSNNVASYLDEIATHSPSDTVFIEVRRSGNIKTDYRNFNYKVNKKAWQLYSEGLRSQDIVLVLVPQCQELFTLILALFKIGATAMFVDLSMERKSMDRVIKEVKPKALVMTPKTMLFSLAAKSILKIPVKIIESSLFNSGKTTSCNRAFPTASVVQTDHALITFTSGSSGTPKAISRSHSFLKNQLEILKEELNISRKQTELTGLPMFVLANIASGAPTILSKTNLSKPSKANSSTLVKELLAGNASSILGSPSLVKNIMDEALKSNLKLPQVKKVMTGGGKVGTSLLKEIAKTCPNASVYSVYGSSEAEPISHQILDQISDNDRLKMETGSGLLVGRPVKDVSVRIESSKCDCAINESIKSHIRKTHQDPSIRFGEVYVSGHHVVKAYFKKMGDSKNKVLVDGKIWHRTKDMGYIDSEGRLWLTGSKAEDKIDTSFSFCIEEVVSSFGFAEKSAFYINEGKGVLFIESSKQTNRIPSLLNESLGFAKIDTLEVVDNIPVDRRHNTKVLYKKLNKKEPGK